MRVSNEPCAAERGGEREVYFHAHRLFLLHTANAATVSDILPLTVGMAYSGGGHRLFTKLLAVTLDEC